MLGRHAPDARTAEDVSALKVLARGDGGQLISPRGQDEPDRVLEVVVVLDQVGRQPIEQFGIPGFLIDVVDRFDLPFDLCLSREDGPLKPEPDLLLAALKTLELAPEEACFIGDGRYDRAASAAARIWYLHLETNPERALDDHAVRSLEELWPLLRRHGLSASDDRP